MAGSTTATLDDLLPSIVQEAMFVASERSIMRGLVRNYSLAAGQGKVVTVPIYPNQTAAALTEGDEVSNTAVSTSAGTITIAPVAIRTLVTDLSVKQSASNVIADLGRLFGEAIARKMDKDLTALFASFSTGAGDYTGNITPAIIFEQVAKLRALGVSMEGIQCVLHPEIAYSLKKTLTTNGTTAFVAGAFASAGVAPFIGGADLTSSRDLRSVTPPGSVLAAFAASSSCDCIPPSACFSSPEQPIATINSAAMSSDWSSFAISRGPR
jgi:hypothetical protein